MSTWRRGNINTASLDCITYLYCDLRVLTMVVLTMDITWITLDSKSITYYTSKHDKITFTGHHQRKIFKCGKRGNINIAIL